MVDQVLLDYVRSQVAAHVRPEDIRAALLTSGWNIPEITEALTIAGGIVPAPPNVPPPPPPPPPPFSPLPPLGNPQPLTNITPQIVETSVTPPDTEQSHEKKPSRHIGAIVTFVVLITLVALGGYFGFQYKSQVMQSLGFLKNIGILQKIGVFGHAPYTQDNLVSGLLDSTSRIQSNSYKASASITVVPREPDATPFAVQSSNEEQLRTQYANDWKRMQDISTLIGYVKQSMLKDKAYPQSLQGMLNKMRQENSYYSTQEVSLQDPSTEKPYGYSRTAGGKDFALTATFETSDAVRAIQNPSRYASSYASSSVEVVGQTVTFSKDSNQYTFLSPEPPKPYLVQLGEMMRMLPAEITASLSASAATDWSANSGEWKFNIDASGDFGDLTYKVNADALKKGGTYYFRVNNIPSIFGELFASNKGKWIKISSTSASTTATSFNQYSYLTSELPKLEKRYKEDRGEFVEFIRKVASLADQEHLFAFKEEPVAESVQGRNLYRYDLRSKKEAILPFYKKMVDASKAYKSIADSKLFNDPGTIEYLQSEEFSQVFDYLDKNIVVSVWVDPDGYPAMFRYTMRIVPPDTATQLKDKQVLLTLEVALSDINMPVVVTEPQDSIPVEDLIAQTEANLNYSLNDARTKGRDARRVADIKQLQLALELYYDAKNTYPASLSALTGPGYIASIPTDPSTKKSYVYAALGSGAKCTSYHLGAVLEATNSSLSTDTDAGPKKICSGSSADFDGASAACTIGKTANERCYDVAP